MERRSLDPSEQPTLVLRRPAPTPRRGGFLRGVRELVFTLAVTVAVFFGTQTVAQARQIEGMSMEPTYHSGERVLVSRYLTGSPGRGDVVIFDPPVRSREDFIKRVIGVPGDRVTIRNGRVFVNGQPLAEPYLQGRQTTCSGRWCDVTLGADQYYVMGDNRPNSSDSRTFGPVAGDRIRGKAWLVVYPLSEIGLAP
jgi:signal peptidase I